MLGTAIAVVSLLLTGGILGIGLLRYYQEYKTSSKPDLKIEKRTDKENILSSIGTGQANLHFYYKVTNEGTGDGILRSVNGTLVEIYKSNNGIDERDMANSLREHFSYSTFGSPLKIEEHVATGETHRMKAHCGINDPDIVEEYDSASFEITWTFEGPDSTYTDTFKEDVTFGGPQGGSRIIRGR
ncbi:MAG TPA: hypothetical protein VFJ06_14250 [Halococcus sp.]|nr:hypothetical protein [Halococcus sp.]